MRYVAPMTDDQLQDFARRYAAAWCSHDPDSVAAFFSEDGSLAVKRPGASSRALCDPRQSLRASTARFSRHGRDPGSRSGLRGIEPSSSGRTRGRTPVPAGPAMRCVSTVGSSGHSARMDSSPCPTVDSTPSSTSANSPKESDRHRRPIPGHRRLRSMNRQSWCSLLGTSAPS